LGEVRLSTSGSVSGDYFGTPFSATGSLTASAEVDGFYLGPVFRFPLGDKMEVLGRVGAYFWQVDTTASASGSLTYAGTTYVGSATANASDDGTDAYFGVGVSYKLNDRIQLGVDWTRFDIDGVDVDNFGARVKVGF
jgi:hypothetical protein